jgi:hypothetical protein
MPLLRRIFAVYAILALGVFAFPGGLVSWLDDRNANGRLAAPLAVMHGIDAASAAVGLKGVGEKLRAGFRSLIGDDDT